jgi:hypothetical protein
MEPLHQLLAPWRQVAARADQFFDAVFERHRAQMVCRPGCADCCRQELTVLLVEALALMESLEALPGPLRRQLARPDRGPCALLHQDRCVVYAQRPVLCRTHGLPVRYADPDRPQQPAEVSWCPLNFTSGEVPPDAVLEGTLLLAGLTVADGMLRDRLGVARPLRIPISELARRGREALPLDARQMPVIRSGQ